MFCDTFFVLGFLLLNFIFFCVVFCGPLFLLGFLSLNLMFSVQCFVINCFKWGWCCSFLCFLCSILWCLVSSRVRVAQSYVFCVVCWDILFLEGFLSLNLRFFVQCFVITCFKWDWCCSILCFCVVFCDALLVVGFVSLNLMFSVCAVFCDPLFVLGFLLLNLIFYV